MAEREQAHRINTEESALSAQVTDTKRGQWMGFSVAMACIVGALLNTYLGGDYKFSIALVSVPVLGIVKALVGRAGDNG